MKKTKAVKAWGIKNTDENIITDVIFSSTRPGVNFKWLKAVRVEIRELRRGNEK